MTPSPSPSPLPKTCPTCGAVHDATAWAALPLVGVQTLGGETTELKNCRCGSTLAIPIRTPKATMVGLAPMKVGSAPAPTRKSAFSGRYSFVHEGWMRRFDEQMGAA